MIKKSREVIFVKTNIFLIV